MYYFENIFTGGKVESDSNNPEELWKILNTKLDRKKKLKIDVANLIDAII